jgi:hypothetical protein
VSLLLLFAEKYDPAWTPAALGADVELWLDAGLGVTQSGGTVSAWADQSSNAYNFIQGTAANEPTFVAAAFGSGNPGLSFDGAGDLLVSSINFTAIPQPYWIFAVVKDWTTNSSQPLIDAVGNGGYIQRRTDLGVSGAYTISGAAYGQFPAATSLALLGGFANDTTSKAWRDGVDHTYATTGGTTQFGQATSSQPMYVGFGSTITGSANSRRTWRGAMGLPASFPRITLAIWPPAAHRTRSKGKSPLSP